ncbi:tetratricopeptide repeat protein [Thiotrichales bacterium 19S11-10]|nr:tetratricopeptide repeat protein [Thiotrichales bacterium 19S11-10]
MIFGYGRRPVRQDSAINFFQIASEHKKNGQLGQAELYYKKALSIRKNFPECYNDLAIIYKTQGLLKQAERYYKKAIKAKPNYSDCMYNLGNLYMDMHQLDNAKKYLIKALNICSDKAIYHNSLGAVYHAKGLWEKSQKCYQKAIELQPDYYYSINNLALVQLSLGNYKDGLKSYESRPSLLRVKAQMPTMPIWQGEDLTNKSIVVITEQGVGDNIQFIRFTKNLKEKGAYVIVHTQKELASLISTCPWVDEVKPELRALDNDYYSLSGSLMYRLNITLDHIPHEVPYLFADKNKRRLFKDRVFDGSKFKVGLVSQGSRTHINDHSRSVNFEAFKSLFKLDNIQFYNLNYPALTSKMIRKYPLVDLSPYIKDFSDTAALIENLDLLISVDTAPVHLAGALNKPCWVLVPKIPDWRWELKGDTSIWYPSLRLFRQENIQVWDDVIERIYKELVKNKLSSTD